MPSIADSTINLDTPVVVAASAGGVVVSSSPVATPALRSTLPSNEILDTVTDRANNTVGAQSLWKLNPPPARKSSTTTAAASAAAAASAVPPPAPIVVAGSAVATASGYSFSFYLEDDPSDVISGYNVYRNSVNSFYGATQIQYIPQPLTNSSTLLVTDPTPQSATAPFFYWITAVNSTGLESQATGVGNASTAGVPDQVTDVNAVGTVAKMGDGTLLELVGVDYNAPTDDPYFNSVNIYFAGYNANPAPQLMTNSLESPASFLCQITGETVEIIVVAVSASNVEADFSSAPYTYLTLNGVTEPPPYPSIAQSQTALDGNTGWQFTFNVIGGLEADQIDCYRIYHSESNVAPTPGSSYFRTIPQPSTNTGQEVVQEVTGDILFYWVSAVNTSGLESELNPVPFTYIDPGAPPPNVNPVETTQNYYPETLLNGWAANAHAGNYESGGNLGSQVWGLNGAATLPYTNPANAFDGNQSTAASLSESHTHQYGGCIWSFANFPALPSDATVQSASVSIVSEVLPTAGPIAGHCDIWYSLDGGNTWTSQYVSFAQRTKQTDTITLSATQDITQVQIMAFLDSHDDIQHNVYEISLSVVQSSMAGPQQVTGVTAALVNGDVQITWNAEVPLTRTDILNYKVYRALHGSGYINSHLQTTVTPTGAATYSWSDPEAHDGTWDYWVIATNSTGYSPASAPPANLAGATSVLYTTASGEIATVDSLRPAQQGADVTAQNIAKDTAAVNGALAATVAQGATGINVNLVPDSDFKFADTYWPLATNWVIGQQGTGGNHNAGNYLAYQATGSSGRNYCAKTIPAGAGQTLTLSALMYSNLTSGYLYFGVQDNLGNIYELDCGPTLSPSGRLSTTFTTVSGCTELTPYYGTGSAEASVVSVFIQQPMLQLGSVMTAYVPNLIDSTTGSFLHGAMSNGVQIAITSGGTVNNLGGVPDGNITPIATLMPAEAGANVTAAHVLTAVATPSGSGANSGTELTTQETWIALTGLGFTMTASGTSDVYNIYAQIYTNIATSTGGYVYVALVVDGNTGSPTAVFSLDSSGDPLQFPFIITSVTGLSAGSHTLQFYGYSTTSLPSTDTVGVGPIANGGGIAGNGSYAICQRIY